MKTIIINGVSCTLSDRTIREYQRGCRELAAEEREAAIHAANVAWLADPANRNSEIYSDVYKDTYGVRPRW